MNAQLEPQYKELLLGAGSRHLKDISVDSKEWSNLTTLDINPSHNPDILHDLNSHPLPFQDNEFDEIHAYEVLEHIGSLGDYEFFFKEWEEYWRIIKPGGAFLASVPRWDSHWCWGDPSHRRVINQQMLTFLSQEAYKEQVGKTSMTDFRSIYHADWELIDGGYSGENFWFYLKAIK